MKIKGKLAELVLGITNLVYFLGGIGILVVGALALSGSSGVVDIMTYVPQIDELSKVVELSGVAEGPGIYMTVFGSVVIVLGLIGCGGIFGKNKIIIAVYGIITTLMMLLNIALLMFYAIDPYYREGTVQSNMEKILISNNESITINGVNIKLPTNENALAWTNMQFEQGCCGVTNYTDYMGFEWNNNYTVNGEFITAKVPPSCCLLVLPNSVPDTTNDFVNLTECLKNSPKYTYNQGCSDYVMQQLTRYDYVYPVVAAGLTGLQALILVLTLWLMLINR